MSEEGRQPASSPSGDQSSSLWQRLKEHRVAQWSVGYVAVAYGIQHAVTLTAEALEWPHGIERASMILLILGLPMVMALAWYHGDRARSRISGVELAVLSLLLLGLSALFYVFVKPSERIAARGPATEQAATAPVAKPAGLSVAVLPFLNLSGDPKQEFFSDGMTEEITSALAKIPNLPVVGRTSAFTFKGKNEDLRKIGRALGAAYLLEGSVRKDGNQVRITGQLIRAETGDHLWTESYDRELKGIFAVQEDVARAIAAALQVPLGLRQGETLVSSRDIDANSYQDYLRAKALIRARRTGTALSPAIALLEQVVTRQPNYAPAWASLAQAYALAPLFQAGGTFNIPLPAAEQRRLNNALHGKAETAVRHAIQLDPRNADALMSLGLLQSYSGRLLKAEQSFQQALGIDPLNPDTLQEYSLLLAGTGQLQAAIAMREKLRSLEPLVPTFNGNTIPVLIAAGEYARALSMAQALSRESGASVLPLVRVYAAMGRYSDAADAALTVNPALYPPDVLDAAVRLLRMAPASAAQLDIPFLGQFSFAFAYVGLPERVLEQAERARDLDRKGMNNLVAFWGSDFRIARKTARFKNLVRDAGLIDYWRAKGWPQYCHPTTGDDFACN